MPPAGSSVCLFRPIKADRNCWEGSHSSSELPRKYKCQVRDRKKSKMSLSLRYSWMMLAAFAMVAAFWPTTTSAATSSLKPNRHGQLAHPQMSALHPFSGFQGMAEKETPGDLAMAGSKHKKKKKKKGKGGSSSSSSGGGGGSSSSSGGGGGSSSSSSSGR